MGTDFQHKIVDLDELTQVVRKTRDKGKTIVQCHGCFDIVHPGHIRYLQYARKQGDVLIVSLTGDALISKGVQRPYIPQELRAENLAALMMVDYVYIDSNPTAEGILQVIQPDVYVKGREYEGSTEPGFLAEKAVVEGYGGRLIFSSGEVVFSSTAIIDQMPSQKSMESHRLHLVCKRYGISRQSVEQCLQSFRDLNVLVVGDVILDQYVLCDAMGVASEAPMLSLVQQDERTYIGGAAIVARHAAAWGARAFLLSSAGSDEHTRRVEEVLDVEGIEQHFIRNRSTLPRKTRFLVDDTKLFKVDNAREIPLDSKAERQASLILEQQSRLADVVIFCDFGYGTITGGLLQRVLPALRQNVRTLSADISGKRANLLNFKHVDLLCPTERELRTTLHDYESGLSSAAWNLLQKTQAAHLLVTLDKRGLVIFERGSQDRSTPEWAGRLKSEQLPSLAEFGLDRLGCGDALLTASTLALASGASLQESAYLGAAAAAVKLSTFGNVPVELQPLIEWMQNRPELNLCEPTTKGHLQPVGAT